MRHTLVGAVVIAGLVIAATAGRSFSEPAYEDRSTGQITPKSIRNFTWDLQMIEFNSGDPLPQDVRSGLQR